ALLSVGLDGLKNKRDPGKRLDIDMYADGHTVKDAKRLPLNLLDALRALDQSSVLKAAFGEDVVASYINIRTAEWNEYAAQRTNWERQATVDCCGLDRLLSLGRATKWLDEVVSSRPSPVPRHHLRLSHKGR